MSAPTFGERPALTIGDSAPEPSPDQSWRRPSIGAQTAMDGTELHATPRRSRDHAVTVSLWDAPADLWGSDAIMDTADPRFEPCPRCGAGMDRGACGCLRSVRTVR